ncbi:MAG TPA: GNAT family N-acetyltransferase [Pseudonocardiaceae bacterium]|nr:GNAT family N-acetyltransferase [Pseudonocardiaceae bacterium]
MLELTPAAPDESGIVIDLLEQAAARLHARGITDQWPLRFEPEWIEAGLRRKQTWLAREDGAVVGTITLNWSDPLWTDLGPTDVAGYVHRLTVLPTARGLGATLLDWAAGEIRAHGRDLLRLDCVSINTRLNEYYRAAGFEPMGEVAVAGAPGMREPDGEKFTLSRYQRYVGERS